MNRALFFDVDGVLADTDKLHREALRSATLEIGLTVVDNGTGTTMSKLLGAGIPKGLAERIYSRKRQIYDKLVEDKVERNTRLIDLFRILREDFRLVACSNSNTESCSKLLTRVGVLPYLDWVVTSSDVEFGKPHPYSYELCLFHVKLPPHKVTVYEDSQQGYDAAHAAGIRDIVMCDTTTILEKLKQWL